MHVLFITRKYPPQIGGMEAFAFGLINNIKCEKEVIALNKKQINLIWWLPYAFISSIIKARKVDQVHLCDGLLAPIGLIIKKIYHKKVTVTVHGLDVTWPNFIYQKICVNSLKHLNKIICVSNSTKQDCLKKNIPENKLFVIPNAIDVTKFKVKTRFIASRSKILLTVGRLVKRKGVAWFINNIMPKLNNVEYWVVGVGPEQENIKQAISKNNLQDKVNLLGFIDDQKLIELYYQADIFIMPNIEIAGDREGFGIVALEANACGLPVLASDLEGIKDVVKNDVNGYLIPEKNIDVWLDGIKKILDNKIFKKKDIQEYCLKNYSWENIATQYLKSLKNSQ